MGIVGSAQGLVGQVDAAEYSKAVTAVGQSIATQPGIVAAIDWSGNPESEDEWVAPELGEDDNNPGRPADEWYHPQAKNKGGRPRKVSV